METQPNKPPLTSLTGKPHGNPNRDPQDSFNTTPRPNWSEPKRPSEQSEYGDIHRLIETTKRELFEKE